MKLTKKHLFFILLLTILFCCGLGAFGITEGMENKDNRDEPSVPNKDGTELYKMVKLKDGRVVYVTPGSKLDEEGTELFRLVKTDEGKVLYETPQSMINGTGYSEYNSVNLTNDSELSKTVTLDDGRVVYATPENTINGIPGRKIPPGQEDLYILKSQVVPPVCPACPTVINKCEGNKECPPCPPCGRCPEASFECVKRPTYKPDNPYLPLPVLADFSSFGM